MNKFFEIPSLCAAGILMASSAWAQAPDPESNPLPNPLKIRIPTGHVATITARRIRPLTDAEKADPIRQSWTPDLSSATVTRDGNRLLIESRWEDGRVSHVYSDGSRTVYQPSLRYPDDVQIDGAGAPNLSSVDFPWLGWILREDLVGAETLQGRKCLVLQQGGPAGNEKSRKARMAAAEAAANAFGALQDEFRQEFIKSFLESARATNKVWLDAETLLPLKSTDGELELEYRYSKRSGAPAEPPPNFRKALQGPQ